MEKNIHITLEQGNGNYMKNDDGKFKAITHTRELKKG